MRCAVRFRALVLCAAWLAAGAGAPGRADEAPPSPVGPETYDYLVYALACDHDAQWMHDVAVDVARQYGAGLSALEYRVLMAAVEETFSPAQLLVRCEEAVRDEVSVARLMAFRSEVMGSREWVGLVQRWRRELAPERRRAAIAQARTLSERREDPRRMELVGALAELWAVPDTEARIRASAAQAVALGLNALRPVSRQAPWNAVVAHYTRVFGELKKSVADMARVQMLAVFERVSNAGIEQVAAASKEGVVKDLLGLRERVWERIGESVSKEIGAVCVRRWREERYREAALRVAKPPPKPKAAADGARARTDGRAPKEASREAVPEGKKSPAVKIMDPAWLKPAFGAVPAPPPVKEAPKAR